jgi:two-component system, OmpR family, sensor histidine kinase KdpD
MPSNERLLVGVSPGPLSARLVRAARRMAAAMRAEWIVVAVETPKTLRLPEPQRELLIQTLRLAEQLGAETVTLSGQHASDTILAYARTRNVTKIVIGKPERPHWQEILFGSTVDELVRRSGDIDVYVISAADEEQRTSPLPALERTSSNAAYGWGTLVIVICTALAAIMFPYFDEANIIMVYLLGIVAVATRLGRGPSILASLLSVAAFDFFFVPPFYTFAVSDVQYLITFAIMLVVALVISTLTTRIKRQADAARDRERRTSALYALSRDFASTRDIENLLRNAVRHINDVFDSQVVIMLPNAGARLQAWGRFAGWWPSDAGKRTIFAPDPGEQGVAQWVYDHSQIAGQGSDTLPGSEAVYLPLIGSLGNVGVLGVRTAQARRSMSPDQLHLLETFANQIALAIERANLADQAQQAQVLVETERTRSSLLSSVSHDLRTPLATITGASSSLLEDEAAFDAATRHELTQTIFDESNRLNRLVGNLLDMTRLESGAITVRKEWQPVEEVIGVALARLDQQLRDRPIGIELPADGALAPFDGLLIEQVLINLLENAIKYTPPASPIDIAGRSGDNMLTISIADCGPGIPPGDEEQIFDKFYRANSAQGGVGLGLTICRAIVAAQGRRIWAANRPGGGASFTFTLPLDGKPPNIRTED